MYRLAMIALALSLVAFSGLKATPKKADKDVAISITSLQAGGTYTNPLVVSGTYSPDPLPSYLVLTITDAKLNIVYTSATVLTEKGTFDCYPANAGPAGDYAVTVYLNDSIVQNTVYVTVK